MHGQFPMEDSFGK
ncbi:Protein of unknown function [Bacillus cytotoxicus]|nr:Protein of unknown function [Bacillus cytotoxicus]